MDPKNRLNENAAQVQEHIDKVRDRGFRLRDDHVTSAHGAGGKASAALVNEVFLKAYGNEVLNQHDDSGVFPLLLESQATATSKTNGSAHNEGSTQSTRTAANNTASTSNQPRLAMSTDSYVVNPIEFPGGSIGDLAVNGTVNDLAVSGAKPLALSAAFVLEEGLEIEVLRRIVDDVHAAADKAGVTIVTGDTKVVPRGAADKLYITTAGVGLIPEGRDLGAAKVQVGDAVILSGPIADHGMAVMMARGDLAINAPIESDTRAINGQVEALLAAAPHTRFMRDATRGGLATVLTEVAHSAGVSVHLEDSRIPVREMTRAACDMLGIDPLYVANEGTFAAIVPEDECDEALAAVPGSVRIGAIEVDPANTVVIRTPFGGMRMVDMLVGDPLPRIC